MSVAWRGQQPPLRGMVKKSLNPRAAQKVYFRLYLFEVDNSFPGRLLMGSNGQGG